jgi:hypothetical protein
MYGMKKFSPSYSLFVFSLKDASPSYSLFVFSLEDAEHWIYPSDQS